MFIPEHLIFGCKDNNNSSNESYNLCKKGKKCIFILISHRFDVPLQRKWLVLSHRKQIYNYKIKNGKSKDINYR